jgi:glucose-6-phosphate 1-dehydrogenase
VTSPDDLRRILASVTGVPALYFALPPTVTIAACAALGQFDLPEGTVLGLEKPFGTDLRSAETLNRQLAKLVPEKHIHRVDHFLGKSTVLNLLGLRFANRIFEQVWNSEHVERVDIRFDETLALEGRAGYYDKAGALVDMIQSHLLLVMALVAMEPPSSLDAEDLRGAMAQVLRATRVWNGDAVTGSRRARYGAGTIDGRRLPAYDKEPGVDPALGTETLAEVTVGVENWRWAGVPFHLRSGKALADKRQEIVVTFKDVPHRPYGFTGDPGPAQLRIALNPDSIQLDLNINGEGNPFTIDRVLLEVDFAAGELGPYGEVLNGILSDDPTLSVRADSVEECWRIVAPVLAAWRKNAVPLDTYRAGSAGPSAWH